ncbi:MAG: hypothetical protein OEX07_11105, partial [Gammaproteobacteria bacterium]|nr:hypothetical protein [Gammaproteobacteria bacterium]
MNRPGAVIFTGFVLILILVSIVLVFSYQNLSSVNHHVEEAVTKNVQKNELTHRLNRLASEHLLLLNQMLDETDVVKKGIQWNQYKSSDKIFSVLMQNLDLVSDVTQERYLLGQMKLVRGKINPVQLQMFDSLTEGDILSANSTLTTLISIQID